MFFKKKLQSKSLEEIINNNIIKNKNINYILIGKKINLISNNLKNSEIVNDILNYISNDISLIRKINMIFENDGYKFEYNINLYSENISINFSNLNFNRSNYCLLTFINSTEDRKKNNIIEDIKVSIYNSIFNKNDLNKSFNNVIGIIDDYKNLNFKMFFKSNKKELILNTKNFENFKDQKIYSIPIFSEEHNIVGGIDFIYKEYIKFDEVTICELCSCLINLFSHFTNEESNEYLISHDPLTGLLNRRSIEDKFNNLKNNLKDDECILFSFLDFDKFKQINDNLGHNIGDLFLKEISKKLKSSLDAKSSLFRYGGDEFLIFSVYKKNNAERIINDMSNKIIEIFEEEIEIEDNTIKISSSFGFSLYPEDSSNLEELIKISDNKMYINKKDQN